MKGNKYQQVTKALALTKEDEWHEVKSKSQQRYEREVAAKREQRMQCERSRAGGNSTTPPSRGTLCEFVCKEGEV